MRQAQYVLAFIGLMAFMSTSAAIADAGAPSPSPLIVKQLSQNSGGHRAARCRKRCERGYNKCMNNASGGGMRGGSQGKWTRRCVKRRGHCLRNRCGING
jgi:hypothetical protein